MNRPGEFDLIHRYFAPLADNYPNAFNLTDDAALISPPQNQNIVVTTDAMVAGVHFFEQDPPYSLAQKLLRVNLSDLAAMGAAPHAYTLTLALPENWTEQWLADFSAGLAEDQAIYDVRLIGGDTVSTPGPTTISLTAFGFVDKGQELRRNGARVGDDIWVSGFIGDAGLALGLITGDLKHGDEAAKETLTARLRLPEPRISLGRELVGVATSAADISDGLIADLGHICHASKRGACIQFADVPLSPTAQSVVADKPELYRTILTGGDDYELIFTAEAGREDEIIRAADIVDTPVSKIGAITDDPSIRVFDKFGAELNLPQTGYAHF